MLGVKALIPTSIDLTIAPREDLTVISYDPQVPVPEEHCDAELIVIWGNNRKQLADSAQRLTQLKWIAALSAGTDVIEAAGFAPEILLTNASGLHDVPVAEHALALSLAAARRLDLMHLAQLEGRWARELGGVQPVGVQQSGSTFPGLGTLRNARVSIWGFGSIAQELAPLFTALGAQVTGIANTAGERSGYRVVDEAGRAELLANTDLLVNILPALPSTEKIINAEILSQLPNHAWLVNVGRGATVDEPALIDALRNRTLGGAALDVFDREPLPADSPMWSVENLIITPHAAGGRPVGASEFLNENIARFMDGRELQNVVKRA